MLLNILDANSSHLQGATVFDICAVSYTARHILMVKCLYLLGSFHKYTVLLKSYKNYKTSKILRSSKKLCPDFW